MANHILSESTRLQGALAQERGTFCLLLRADVDGCLPNSCAPILILCSDFVEVSTTHLLVNEF